MKSIALDVGARRIGVARADTSVKIAIPECTIIANGQEFAEIAKILKRYDTSWLVLGLPRNSKGEETAQSTYVRGFAKKLKQAIPGVKIRFQDESLTSVEAEQRLKSRKRRYEKGEIDAEAASIILQDFIENYTPSAQQNELSEPDEKPKKKHHIFIIAIAVVLILVVASGSAAYAWYDAQLKPFVAATSCSDLNSEELKPTNGASEEDTQESNTTEDPECRKITFSIASGESISTISHNLESAGLIHSALAFRLYYRLHQSENDSLKVGSYVLNRSMSVQDIVDLLVKGDNRSNVFSFTILPGETIKTIKSKLAREGYSETDINTAFSKNYDYWFLKDRKDTSAYGAEPLEGFIFGDTYEFYKGESVENIVKTALNAFDKAAREKDLENKFTAQGLNMYQGVTLASIVQKEGIAGHYDDIAKVFLNRLSRNMALGSDVTTKFAADLIDPERKTYTNNADILKIDSLYNTRLYTGLPPGPICNPGLVSLEAVANPSDTDAIYFLTGDDGMMYYSTTEEGHLQNIREHCRESCATAL